VTHPLGIIRILMAETSLSSEVVSLARDINRHLTDLLGPCPIRNAEAWVVVSVNDEGQPSFTFASATTHEAEAMLRAVRDACDARENRSMQSAASYNPNGIGINFREHQRADFHVPAVHP
jgi:hypothetical protein